VVLQRAVGGVAVLRVELVAFAAGRGAEDAADLANHASGIVVGKLGTAAVLPEELFE
jgi:D-beta-D-heptose 7-phosphate kinase/D-beta-D-heptose 1-phosphate adenosyltransferase